MKEFVSQEEQQSKNLALQLNPWVPGGSGKFASVW